MGKVINMQGQEVIQPVPTILDQLLGDLQIEITPEGLAFLNGKYEIKIKVCTE